MAQPVDKIHTATSWLGIRANTCLISGLLLLMPTVVTGKQSTETLRQTVLKFLQVQTEKRAEQDIEISVGRIDRRLKLATCQESPMAFLAAGAKLQGKLTVGLRCTGPKPWTVYVPAHIKIFANVIAAAQPLLRGSEISATDVIFVRQELSQLRSGYFIKTESVIGKILTQNLSAGHAITPKRVKAAFLVRRGEKVTIEVSIGTLKVRGKGEALKDAARGELVSVRNSQSKRIVQGVVTKPGTVNIQM
ncbi:MAG: flagellar basal body P-ring formation protein FlgA [Gammaproteobacteria bacterium]|nr:flagellar basal body P-ring formation protein FlgA [Gammaproteobacteria bacterium]MCF6261712.1 flagellar basal body P-ring formation protein FlgA [Gammaproteobacteria bacterium]